ncbi:MAG: selenocysteine-specific translation elongation factor [Acidimicrobiia bacterium]
MPVIATAGHVDHGKSSLVRAITGTDPDRLEEERRRGMTIDLGFAHVARPGGAVLSFVDVPGHVRFVANMLAGAAGADGCVLVVDAGEGWMPQTEEHLRILDALGLRRGVVAITKCDRVDAGARASVRALVAARTRGTFLEDSPVVETSARTGDGVEALCAELESLVASERAPDALARPRLWVDRSFAPRGSGTVVTGTLIDGPVHEGESLVVARTGAAVRVREVQHHGARVASLGPGHRCALNLVGVEHRAVVRGDALVRADEWPLRDEFDASIAVLPGAERGVGRRGAWAVHLGAGEWRVRLRPIGGREVAVGARGPVRVRLDARIPLRPGDRFVLRDVGRGVTVAGGEVLDVAPVRRVGRASPDGDPARLVRERGWLTADEFARLAGRRHDGVPGVAAVGPWVTAPETLEAMRRDLAMRVVRTPDGLEMAHLDEHERAVVAALPDVVVAHGVARLRGADPLAEHPYVALFARAGVRPPDARGLDRDVLRRLVQRGVLLESDGEVFHAGVAEEMRPHVRALLAAHPGGFTVSQLRERLGITRKHAVPLAALLDRLGITRRQGDARVGGARL